MPKLVAIAVVREDPPEVFLAEDETRLNWVLALKLIAKTPGRELNRNIRDRLRAAILEERWGDAVELWMQDHPEVDVYPSFELYTDRDVELAAQELEFTPLFQD
jgi:hypothetical protein